MRQKRAEADSEVPGRAGDADNTVTEPPIHTLPGNASEERNWCGGGINLHRPASRDPGELPEVPWVLSELSAHLSNNGAVKVLCGCLIVTAIVYLLSSSCNKICRLTMNDPCVRQRVPMAVTEGLQMCSSAARRVLLQQLHYCDSSPHREAGASWWLQPRRMRDR